MAENNLDANSEVNKDTSSQPQEKLIPQSEVNLIVGREKQHAAERARREAKQEHLKELEEIKRQQELQNVNAAGQKQDINNAQNGREINTDQLYQQLQERFYKDQEQKYLEKHINEAAANYTQNMEKGKGRYSDFEEVAGKFDPRAFPNLVYLVSGMENAADIIYDLSKNPSKLANLDYLAKNPHSVDLARSELLKLSNSITENRNAQEEAKSQNVNSPLAKMQPSLVSGNNGKLGIRDLRSQKYLRG